MKYSMKLLVLLLFSGLLCAEPLPYEIEKDRFTFAQMYLAVDYSQYAITSPLSTGGDHSSSLFVPSVTIGALHYWGLADFYVNFPFKQDYASDGISYAFSPGIETGFKYYPISIQNNSLRGFVGTAFTFPSYSQKTNRNQGADKSKVTFLGLIGVSYTLSPFMFDIGIKYTPDNSLDYYISPTEAREMTYSKSAFYISTKWYTDTTTRSRKTRGWDADLPKGIYPYVGIGPSSAWSMNDSSFVDNLYPYLDIQNDPTVFPELSAGIHLKTIDRKGHRTIFNVSYRPQTIEQEGFGVKNKYTNSSLAFEAFQSFWDYNGFVPFAGVSYALNQLEFEATRASNKTKQTEYSRDLGLVFGWDILPTQQRSWFLRTTLRYYTDISIATKEGEIQFPNFEFNFIQFIYQF